MGLCGHALRAQRRQPERKTRQETVQPSSMRIMAADAASLKAPKSQPGSCDKAKPQMSLLDLLHGRWVADRRSRVLARHLSEVLPRGATVLDVGSGDGNVASLIMEFRKDLTVRGVDVLVRPSTRIPVTSFDGTNLPFPDESFDVVMFVDVLHHTEHPTVLLREAMRVARKGIAIKDHTLDGPGSRFRLRFMDWVGNARFGVNLPYNYWPTSRWSEAFAGLGLRPAHKRTELGLYPGPADWIFGRGLHFLTLLEKT
jgi:SAM-dependent methyltransferase